LVVERIGRIIDLKPKSEGPAKAKRFDDPLDLVIVDDKPVIIELMRSGLADTAWKIHGKSNSGEAIDFCARQVPDLILVSLSLPEGSGYTLFQILRASAKTKTVPVFALCVKTALDEQARAQQAGFTGIITKPIDIDDLKTRITRTLNLDTSYKYFIQKDGYLLLRLPANFNTSAANDVTLHLRRKVTEAVDSGLSRLILDLSLIEKADITLIKLGFCVIQLCHELSIRVRVLASSAVYQECRNYEETKDWPFATSLEEAIAAFSGRELVST
jgi:two-component system cell cycle response regulator